MLLADVAAEVYRGIATPAALLVLRGSTNLANPKVKQGGSDKEHSTREGKRKKRESHAPAMTGVGGVPSPGSS